MVEQKPIIWKNEYSVNVKEIDDQHRIMFEIINNLIVLISSPLPNKEDVQAIIGRLVEYKVAHFATEEKYFHKFNFGGTVAHEEAHKKFDEKVKEIQAQHPDSVVAASFALVDYLEDWLIGHLIGMDQEYKKCFNEHGLF